MAAPPFDVKIAQRWFAVEFNNRAWDLVESPQPLTPAQTDEMIHAAHAACVHWLAVGNALNHLRAECLLATVYAKAGLPESAVRHAEIILALSREAGETQTAFDRASVHGAAALAYRLAHRPEEAQRQYALALAATTKFDDPSELPVFQKLYPAS